MAETLSACCHQPMSTLTRVMVCSLCHSPPAPVGPFIVNPGGADSLIAGGEFSEILRTDAGTLTAEEHDESPGLCFARHPHAALVCELEAGHEYHHTAGGVHWGWVHK